MSPPVFFFKSVCVRGVICSMSVDAHGIQKRVSDPLEVTGSCESPAVGTGNRTSDPLCKSSHGAISLVPFPPHLTSSSSDASGSFSSPNLSLKVSLVSSDLFEISSLLITLSQRFNYSS